MARGDGTGPLGSGPMTGRGLGGCGTTKTETVVSLASGFLGRRGIGRGTAGVALLGLALTDLSKKDGILRSFGRKVLGAPAEGDKYIRNVKYEAIDDKENSNKEK
ncbi:MAG: DUF5320 domain-containing protein [Thermodesulfobacteriota bacterium]|nr:DUF5320 domain-containing protein [Thermodesulfobacteriota bacterium]